jgi:hypothetical protein
MVCLRAVTSQDEKKHKAIVRIQARQRGVVGRTRSLIGRHAPPEPLQSTALHDSCGFASRAMEH